MMWSMGAFLENPDRRKLEIYMNKNTKLKMPKLPDGDSIFNYNVNVHTGKWFHWNSLVNYSRSIFQIFYFQMKYQDFFTKLYLIF